MRGLLVAVSLLLVGGLFLPAPAALSRAAMITEISGGGELDGRPVRTLQVLPEGSKVGVPEGAVLRLVYLQSGSKETINGPCLVQVGSTASRLLEGSGKVREQQGSGARTNLRRTENIRRMGGSLQAHLGPQDERALATPEQSPQELLALLPDSEVPPPPGPAALPRIVSVDDSRLRLLDVPLVSFSDEPYQKMAWEGGQGPFQVSLLRNGEQVASDRVPFRNWTPGEVRFIPGQLYELSLLDEQSNATLTRPFMVLLPSEKMEFEANVAEFSEMLGGSERDRLLTRITLAEDWGLWLDALSQARLAVKAYPQDSGFQAALGRALFNLGRLSEARQALSQARELESAGKR
jgi:hypothetical protein